MSKVKKYGIAAVVLAVILFVYYYVTLPAVNIHAGGFWTSLIFILVVPVLQKKCSYVFMYICIYT